MDITRSMMIYVGYWSAICASDSSEEGLFVLL